MSISRLSLFKRSNDKWHILFPVGARRKWESTGETRKSAALKRLTEFQDLLRLRAKSKTLSEFSTEFLSYSVSVYAKPTRAISSE